MSGSTRVFAHRVAHEDSIEWHSWWAELNGVHQPVGARLDGWDAATPLTLELRPDLDLDLLRSSTGIKELGEVHLAIEVNCPRTMRRFVASEPIGTTGEPLVRCTIDSEEVAEWLELGGHVVHLAPAGSAHGSAARRLAASPTSRVWIEGEAGRFPTDWVSFQGLRLPAAPWTVTSDWDNLDEAFMGSVRLMLNEDHPWSSVVQDEQHEMFAFLSGLLRADVVRSLVGQVASSGEPPESDEWPDESVGDVVDAMCRLTLGRGLAAATELRASDPTRFEMVLQASLLSARVPAS